MNIERRKTVYLKAARTLNPQNVEFGLCYRLLESADIYYQQSAAAEIYFPEFVMFKPPMPPRHSLWWDIEEYDRPHLKEAVELRQTIALLCHEMCKG